MKWFLRFVLLHMFCAIVFAQGFNAFQQTTFTTVTVGQTLIENTVIGFNQLSWTVSGTVSTCTVSLDSSPDGTTWTVNGIITGQTCTSNGNSVVTAGSANFMRVNMQAISGAGATVVVTYKGWVQNPNGGGSSTNPGISNVVNAATFGLVSDNSVTDASVSNASNIITCPNSDCHFNTTAAIGQVMQGGTTANGPIVPIGTITSVDSDTQVHVSTTSTNSAVANLAFAWGPDNTTALTNAYNASVKLCQYLYVPAGTYITGFLMIGQNANCANQNAGRVGGIYGAGPTWLNTTFIIRYDVNLANCTGGSTGHACMLGVNAADYRALNINYWNNTGNPGSQVELAENNQGYWDRVAVAGWLQNNANIVTCQFTGTQAIAREGVCSGGEFAIVNTGTQTHLDLHDGLSANFGFVNSGGSVLSKGSTFSGTNGAYACNAGECHQDNDLFQVGGAVTNAGRHYMNHVIVTPNNMVFTTSSGGVSFFRDMNFTTAGSTMTINSGGLAYDLGGTTQWGNVTVTNNGGWVGLPTPIAGVTAAKLVLSAGWGTTAAWSALTGLTTFQGTITASGTGQAANPTITYTFPTPMPVTPQNCVAWIQKSNDAAVTITNQYLTASALTKTGVTWTYAGTPVNTDTYIIYGECNN